MAGPTVLQSDFTAGIRRHRSRDDLGRSIGANVLWDSKDYIIGRLGVPLGKRGGWGYHSGTLASTPGRVRAICDAPFNGGHYLLAVEADGTVQRSASPFTSWAIDGTTQNVGAIKQNPIFFLDEVIYPSHDGATNMYKSNEVNVEVMTVGSYKLEYIAWHRGHLVGTDGETLAYGPPGNPTNQAWDDAATYDLSQPGKGCVSIGGVLLVFGDSHTSVVRGRIPAGYGVTTDDISIETFSAEVGCIDAFSITHWQGTAIWADRNGIWQTDGSAQPLDLTWQGGIKDLWLQTMQSYSTDWRIAAGIYSDLLFVTINNKSTNAFVDCFVCDLPRRVWYRMTNMPFTCFTQRSKNGVQTWAGVESTTGRVATLSGILSPTSSNYQDANGTDVLPVFETAYYRFSPGPVRIHDTWLGFEADFLGNTAALTDQNITYTAVKSGEDGNLIKVKIEVITSGTANVVVDNSPHNALGYPLITIQVLSATTKGAVVALITASREASQLITASVPGGNSAQTLSALTATALSGGTTVRPGFSVAFSGDPQASPSFTNEGLFDAEVVYPDDQFGIEDRGYHWKRVPNRSQSPGLSIKVTQTQASAKTAIHALGVEVTSAPSYRQQ